MPLITKLSRRLRNNMTEVEKILWQVLKKRKFKGLRFLRQKPIIYKEIDHKKYFFIADFICYEKKVIIELDGLIHLYQQQYDINRDSILSQMGFKIIRLSNDQVISNIQTALQQIDHMIFGSEHSDNI